MKRFEPSSPIAGLASAPRTLVDMLRARVRAHSDVDGSERLEVVHEIDVRSRDEASAALSAVRTATGVAHEIQPHAVVLISRGTLPKTSSGKVRRPACRAAHTDGLLEVVAESRW